MDSPSLFIPEFKEAPLWLDDVDVLTDKHVELPEKVDVLVVGSGYTGLNAAIETARAGRTTLVIDSGNPGQGCSTRNGGQISTSIKPSLAELAAKVGMERARAIRQTGLTALEWIETRVREEGIDCDFRRCGKFHAAHTPAQYAALLRDVPRLAAESIEAHPVSRSEQHTELGTDAYHGGLVFPSHASLHPARYHRGLLRTALESGASMVARCTALSIEREKPGASTAYPFKVQTDKGLVHARDVIVATNGYTGALTPWLRRRTIPVGSHIMATEPLAADVVDRLFPTDRNITDTCKVVYYYRLSPDRQRVVFGGRVSAGEIDLQESARRLHQQMCRLFPELAEVRVSHSWSGTVAYSFDELMHSGLHDGMHFSLGYCGSGVSMASYMGMRLGQRVLGLAEGSTALDDLPFPTRPFYHGKPWFLPPIVAWYRLRDRLQTRAHARA